ncbi:hypothetical protein A3Q56_06799 [Intoshia linei]|uniref:Large ribosomal subunit protein uL13 n=1 Tax=Intoshia linei TaxID=1819745 RepID=A0A177AWA8_9BILA|nr:hypothetical protein A3Q56_06799 [Intoshia linei]
MSFLNKQLVIDGRGHLKGRLAAFIAKKLLQGQDIVVVRCEDIMISGSFYRNKVKRLDKMNKRTNTNHTKGPFHFKAPSKIFIKSVRGMLPHKTARGQKAFDKLKTYDGIPPPFDQTKRYVVNSCLRCLRVKPKRKCCQLGRLAHETGWKYQRVIQALESKRKLKNKVFYENVLLEKKMNKEANKEFKDNVIVKEANSMLDKYNVVYY